MQTRDHNKANETDTNDDHGDTGEAIAASTGENWYGPVYGAAGNMTKAPKPGDENETGGRAPSTPTPTAPGAAW